MYYYLMVSVGRYSGGAGDSKKLLLMNEDACHIFLYSLMREMRE